MAKSVRTVKPAVGPATPVETRDGADLNALEQTICRDANEAPAHYVVRADVVEDGE